MLEVACKNYVGYAYRFMTRVLGRTTIDTLAAESVLRPYCQKKALGDICFRYPEKALQGADEQI